MSHQTIDLFSYQRRMASVVNIGGVYMGGQYPIRLQSMTNTPTLNTEATAEQCKRIIDAGADFVRITTPAVRDAENLAEIKKLLRKDGYNNPLVADVHFNPAVAEVAARIVEKVRINPGNYVDKKKFEHIGFTDKEYALEMERIRDRVLPLLKICKEHGTAIRIGVNHGSLSDRIMSRYGDTPEGMAESAMEFLRIFSNEGFHQTVISMKSSNTRVMVYSTRLLVDKMSAEGMFYPVHLGVTEAGEGEDGIIKSAVGIGTLLAEGIGETIRVSLTGDPEQEIPVAKSIVNYFNERGHQNTPETGNTLTYNRYDYLRRPSTEAGGFGNGLPTRVVVVNSTGQSISNFANGDVSLNHETAANDKFVFEPLSGTNRPWVIEPTGNHAPGGIRYKLALAQQTKALNPVVLRKKYVDACKEDFQIKAACDFGPLLIDGMADGIWLENPHFSVADVYQVSLNLLQASRLRMSKTEYISCPSCGRTLFDLSSTTAKIRQQTSHLKHLKIGVMGCIVNGPGEMADADYGYVGTGPGKITLYKSKEVVKRNIPESEAVNELVKIIKSNGDWIEP